MRGIFQLNKKAFSDAAQKLRDAGHVVINPHDLDDLHNKGPSEDDYVISIVRRDLQALLECDAIYMLPGWQQSIGARAEYHAAIFAELEIMNPPNRNKEYPVVRGLLDYFPDACMEVANISKVANDQHNPGEPMHWDRSKSTDHADCLVRHLLKRDTMDTDGLRHTAKVAWRALALLQTEIEQDNAEGVL
jgi:hypothetical protein